MNIHRIAVLLFGVCILACGSSASSSSSDAAAAKTDAKDGSVAAKLVKLDFLWVIDQSPSMCQEQRALTKGVDDFIANLQKAGIADVQMAVVTVQQIADLDKTQPGAVQAVGQFMHAAATTFPPNCMAQNRVPCGGDTPCSQACAGDAVCIQQ